MIQYFVYIEYNCKYEVSICEVEDRRQADLKLSIILPQLYNFCVTDICHNTHIYLFFLSPPLHPTAPLTQPHCSSPDPHLAAASFQPIVAQFDLEGHSSFQELRPQEGWL